MTQKPLPPQGILKQLLDYDLETGALTWRERSCEHFQSTKTHSASALAAQFNSKYAGKSALSAIDGVGYPSGRLLGSQVRAHRVIWKMVHGYEPALVDHINRDTTDNRLSNLRAANKSINGLNRNAPAHNSSGRVGVSWDKRRGKWVAQISVSGRHQSKRFSSFEAAVSQREAWEKEAF